MIREYQLLKKYGAIEDIQTSVFECGDTVWQSGRLADTSKVGLITVL